MSMCIEVKGQVMKFIFKVGSIRVEVKGIEALKSFISSNTEALDGLVNKPLG